MNSNRVLQQATASCVQFRLLLVLGYDSMHEKAPLALMVPMCDLQSNLVLRLASAI
jgi:hypothetical protein